METTGGKSEELYQTLRAEVLTRKAGERFLPIREIMKRFGMSQSVVDRAITRLRAERYLIAEAGRGLFVSDDAALAQESQLGNSAEVLLMMPRWVSCDIDEFNETLEQINQTATDLRLRSDYFDHVMVVPRNLEVRLKQSAGLIIVPSSSRFTPQDFNTVCRYCELCPTIMFGHHFDSFGVCNVGLDDCAVAHTAMHHLWQCGHRHIGILISEPHSKTIMERVRAAQNFSIIHGMTTEIIDCEVRPGEVATPKTYQRTVRMIRNGFSFTALLGIAGESMLGAVNACRNHNIAIPDELSMLAIAGENLTRISVPPIDTVPNDTAGQLRAAFELIRKLRPDPIAFPFENLYWSPDLVIHGSVRRLTHSKQGISAE